MLTKKKLKKEIKDLLFIAEAQTKEIVELEKQVGYSTYSRGLMGYFKPSVSVAQKIDLLLDHLGLYFLFQAERLVLVEKKKKRTRKRKK